MEALFHLSNEQVFLFSLIFIRISGLCLVSPLFGAEQVPLRFRILFALGFAFVLFPVIGTQQVVLPTSLWVYGQIVIKEIGIGFLIGFLAMAMIFGFQIGGRIISIHLGLRVANMVDPFTDVSVTTLGTFVGLIVTIIFLVLNGHHFILKAMVDSFRFIPVMSVTYNNNVFQQGINLFNVVITTAFKISAPTMIAFFSVSLVFAFIARLVPQMNVFILSLPVKIGAGILILMVSLPIIAVLFVTVMERVISDIYRILAAF